MIWIDNLGAAEGVLQEFKDWFEDPNIPKVWHNYGFDRHVLFNEGINCKGFYGDTMHMARLWDTSRGKRSVYDHSAACASCLVSLVHTSHFLMRPRTRLLRKDQWRG